MANRPSILIVDPDGDPESEGREVAGVAPGLARKAVDSISRALFRLGHSVTVACDVPTSHRRDGVSYIPVEVFSYGTHPGRSWDVAVFCDDHEALSTPAVADLIGAWFLEGPTPAVRESMGRVVARSSFSVFWSRFHRQQLEEAEYHGRSFEGIGRCSILSPPGVDFDAIDGAMVKYRSEGSGTETSTLDLLYAERPEAGLDLLLQAIWPGIRERYRDARLLIVSEREGWTANPRTSFHRFCRDLIDGSPEVVTVEVDSRSDLWQRMLEGTALFHLAREPVLCSDLVLEAQALGLPIVASARSTLADELAFSETKVEGAFGSSSYAEEFVSRISRLIEDREFRTATRVAGKRNVSPETHGWDAIARRWSGLFDEIFESRFRSQKAGLLRRLLSLSDFRSARLLVTEEKSPEEIFDPLDLDDFRTMSERERAIWEIASRWCHYGVDASSSHDYQTVIECCLKTMLCSRETGGKPRTILDVGGSAPYTILPWLGGSAGLELTVLAIGREDAAGIRSWVAELGLEDRVEIVTDAAALDQYDVVVMCDVLQQAAEVNSAIVWAESLARVGVVGSVPYGPWRRIADDPSQVHHLAYRELAGLLGRKADFETVFCSAGRTRRGEDLGWWIFAYQSRPEAPTGTIDPELRLGRISPLAKITATILVKNEEANLRRCLSSFEDLVDEVILGDTGSTDQTLKIATQMGYRPIDHKGRTRKNILSIQFEDFAQARNEIHAHANGEFVFWLDADEALIRGQDFRFWTDQNQHHDAFIWGMRNATVESDSRDQQPVVRCFRRAVDGRPVRWLGCIHETPALGVNQRPWRYFSIPNGLLVHTGYLYDRFVREKERNRNLELLIKDRTRHPDRRLGYYYGMRHYLNVGRWEIQEASCMTTMAYKSLNYGFEIWRNHIAGCSDFGALGYKESRMILQLLGQFGMPLRSTGKIPFEADVSVTAEIGALQQDERLLPHSRTYYADPEELREEVERRLAELERSLYRGDLPCQVSTDIGESGALLDCHLAPELFGLEPF